MADLGVLGCGNRRDGGAVSELAAAPQHVGLPGLILDPLAGVDVGDDAAATAGPGSGGPAVPTRADATGGRPAG
jgi:hypothetical protein